MTLKGTAQIVNPAGITTVDFRDEVDTANFYAKLLGLLGIRSLVLVHPRGWHPGRPPPVLDPSSCNNFTGAIAPIVAGLNPNYGVVVSGHTHQWYTLLAAELPAARRWSPAPVRSAAWSPTSR